MRITIVRILVLLLVSGCSTQEIRMTELLKPGAVVSRDPIPVYMGIVIPDETANYTLRGTGPGRTGATGGGVELFLGQAVKENLGVFLESVFRDVVVSNSIEALPADVKDFAIIRFVPGNELYMPFSIFTDTRIVVVLEFEVFGKDRVSVWKVEAEGVAIGKHPPIITSSNFGGSPPIDELFNPKYPVSDFFYKSMTEWALKAAFEDLAARIRYRADTWAKK